MRKLGVYFTYTFVRYWAGFFFGTQSRAAART